MPLQNGSVDVSSPNPAGQTRQEGNTHSEQLLHWHGRPDTFTSFPMQPSSANESLRERVWRIIFLADTRAGKAFDVALLWMILGSVCAIMLESVAEIDAKYHPQLDTAEWIFTILFTIEYGVRIAVARRPLRYMVSFFGIVDLISILPTYLTLLAPEWHAENLAVVRVLRLLRMFRVLKMARHMGEARVLLTALKASWPKVTVFLFGVFSVVTIMGTALYLIESPSNEEFSNIPKAIYWAIVTITTVGYGDITPHTALGQLISAALMIIGYAILAVPTGIVGAEVYREKTLANKLSRRECIQCGCAAHLMSARFCQECGAELPAEEPPNPQLEAKGSP